MLKENFNTFQNLHRSFKLRQMFCLGDQFRFNGWIQRRIKRQGFLDSVFCGSAEDINAVIDILQSMRQIQVDIISNQAGQKILSVAVATVCAFIIGVNILLIFVAIGMVSWLDMARIVRGQTLSLKRKEFIEAAQVGGVSTRNIVIRHIVPNVLGVVVVYASLLVPSMILFESFLSFLGLGTQEPLSSWGALLSDGANSMEVSPWLLLFPAGFLVVTLFCFNFIGDGLRDALDPKDR